MSPEYLITYVGRRTGVEWHGTVKVRAGSATEALEYVRYELECLPVTVASVVPLTEEDIF